MRVTLTLCLSAFLASSIASAKTFEEIQQLGGSAQEIGLAIAQEADLRDEGFGDFQVDMTMTLKNPEGQSSIRKVTSKTFERPDPSLGDKSMLVFHEPKDVSGTALLTYSNVLEQDDQWLYLPALKRVKRISSKNKSGSFVGSEFAYEDLASQEVAKYSYQYITNEPCPGDANLTCIKMERIPQYKNSGYSKQVVWLDTEHFRAQKIDYYDRKRALMKTLTFTGYQQYVDKFWRAKKMTMVNNRSQKSTELLWENYQFQSGLKESDFTKAKLKRAK